MGKASAASPTRHDIGTEILALVLLAGTAFLFLSVYSEHLDLTRLCGPAGSAIGHFVLNWVGTVNSYLLILVAGTWSVCMFFRLEIPGWRWRLAGVAVLLPGLAALECVLRHEALPGFTYRGGPWGEYLVTVFYESFDATGTYLAIALLLAVGFLLATDMLISPVARFFAQHGGRAFLVIGQRVPGWIARVRAWVRPTGTRRRPTTASRRAAVKPPPAPPKKKSPEPEEEEEEWDELDDELEEDDELEDDEEYEDEEEGEDEEEDDEYEDDEEYEEDDEEDDEEDEEEDVEEEEQEEAPPARKIRIREQVKVTQDESPFTETQLSLSGVYDLPPMNFLDDPPDLEGDGDREELEEVAQKIERTLASFKIEARVGQVQRGPVITQYEVSLAAGIKVHKIVSLADDLAMALSARSVRVVAPIPGKSTVGVEVPNRDRETVHLKEILGSKIAQKSDAHIPIALGKDAAGDPIVEDLTRMPHLLIAGSTGSGKSVCINSIISSILMTRTPEELKLILVDPKMVELAPFEDIPHLLTPVVTDMKKAPAALEWCVRKMDQRYKMLSLAEVRHIHAYNKLGKEKLFERLSKKISHEEAEQAPELIPSIVIVIDELADLMMTASKDVEASITRLAQKSRAVGIHVILATQRPSVDVITGLIKSNLPCRVSFKVSSRIDSRTILDANGAEKLLGQGDMLYLPPGTSTLVRAQSTFISDSEIKRITSFLKKENPPEFNTEIAGYLDGSMGDGENKAAQDELFNDAVRIVLESQRGSTSLLQRRLGIGYTRASRLMDLMTEAGIVGAFKGSKAREVFMTLEDWDEAQEGG